MPISLSERQENISLFLQKAAEPVGIEVLADRFNISKRSVYYDLEMIERWASFSDFVLLRDSKEGVLIKTAENEKPTFNIEIYLSPENRKKSILLQLFFNESFLTAQEISTLLGVSRNTIINDIRALRESVTAHGVEIEGVRSHGYTLSGNEERIRDYLTNLIISDISTYDLISLVIKEEKIRNAGLISNFLDSELDFSQVKKGVKAASKEHEFWLPDIDYVHFIIYQAISIKRVGLGHKIEKNLPFSRNIRDSVEYLISKSVWKSLEQQYSLENYDPEIIKTSKMLLACNIKINNKKSSRNKTTLLLHTVVEKMIEAIIPVTSFMSEEYLKLRQDIFNHLELTVKQIQFGIVGENPLLNKIKIHYSQSYKLAEKMASLFTEYFDIPLPESEIGFLALHIAVYLEAAYERKGQSRAIVICNSGKGSANILAKRLKMCIPDLEIKGNYSILEIEENNNLLEGVDLIISTINYANNFKPVLRISPLLSENEIRLIKNFLHKEDISTTDGHHDEQDLSWTSLCQRLIDQLGDDVDEKVIDEIRAFELYIYEHFLNKVKDTFVNDVTGDKTAMIVLDVMNMIGEIDAIGIELSKEASTGLLIHVIMSVGRWKRGDFFEEPDLANFKKEYPEVFTIVLRFLENCQRILNRSVPESEAVSILRYFL
jgi:mannitol operon transcriptional antiterminator